MQGSRISVLIVETNAVVRWAMRRFLEEHGMSAVGEATTLADAVDLADIQEPDVVLMGLPLQDDKCTEATRRLSRDSGIRVLAYGASDEARHVDAFLEAGGAGFVSRTAPVNEIPKAIRAALDNRRWVSPSLTESAKAPTRQSKDAPTLSSREQEVAVLIAKGLSSSQVADKLFVSLNTVETHRYRIFKKLGIHSRAELVDYVLREGFTLL